MICIALLCQTFFFFFYKPLSCRPKCKLLNTIYKPSNSICVIYICTALQNTEKKTMKAS